MPFTSPELVRAHLSGLRAGAMPILGVSAVLTGTASVQLPHAGVTEGSVIVKALRLDTPVHESVTLGSEWTGLSHTQLVADSVLAAADGSLSTVYAENADYIADYAGGRLKRLPDGAIQQGQNVTVWYDYYHVYTEGDDYAVDAANGILSRKATGAIADGQTVFVDYVVGLGTIADAVIESAIAEVDEAVLAMLDPQYQDQAVPGIVIGETHWAVATVCRMRAAASLAESGILSGTTHNLARVWLELADRYQHSGQDRLARFAAPHSGLRAARKN